MRGLESFRFWIRGSGSSPLPFFRFFFEDLSALAGAADVNENERRCGVVVKAIAVVVEGLIIDVEVAGV